MRRHKNITRRYNSIGEFVAHLDKGVQQAKYDDSQTKGDAYWYGTASYKEANDTLLFGDKDNAEKIMKSSEYKEACRVINAQRAKREVFTSVAGFAPHVPNYICGVPNQMLRTRNVQAKKKTITLAIACSVECGIDASEMRKASENLALAISKIEASGTRVQVFAGCGFTSKYMRQSDTEAGDTLAAWVKIKDYQQQLDLLRMIYPLGNPSFFRRHMFRLMEITPGLNDSMRRGYGYQMNDSELRRDLNRAGIKADAVINIRFDRNKTPKMLVEYIEKQINKK